MNCLVPAGLTGSAREDVKYVSRRPGQGWFAFFYGFFMSLFPLALQRNESELPSDLYVMF